ncbi:rod-binding protein [Spirochaeta africana]|uniref:Rod binding protein n=1 Tax=Spirochaeta africana (strain ATCC 700263 / DSM 8902 / Z-7692) TaxID=889378 RepID=H9UKB3_SPIAZ|nr:rod-binding protein [Spirochaeta africana]AFG37956.1 Rod binding protein [Spirochaeta africana DSM 8902]
MTTQTATVDFSRFLSQPKTPRADQARGDDAALREVTREFEALFVKQMLDAMYNTLNTEEGLFYGGESEKIFRDMLNMEYAREMSHNGSFGLSDMMYDQLQQRSSAYEAMSDQELP